MNAVTPSAGVLCAYIAAFPFILFGAFWALGHLFAAVSGWSALAARYSCDAAVGGAAANVHSGRLGLIGYGGVLTVTPTERGLHLDVAFIPGHPPVLIPWNDVEIAATTGPRINVTFTNVQGLTLALGGAGASEISRYAAGRSPSPQFGAPAS